MGADARFFLNACGGGTFATSWIGGYLDCCFEPCRGFAGWRSGSPSGMFNPSTYIWGRELILDRIIFQGSVRRRRKSLMGSDKDRKKNYERASFCGEKRRA